MPLLLSQRDGFLRIIEGLVTFKNRNSRLLGAQFMHMPDRMRFPDYHKVINNPRTLEMVQSAYDTPSQVYLDMYTVFQQVEDTVGKSSVTFRDAVKMQSIMDELWEQDKNLPALDSLEPGVRPDPSTRNLDGPDTPARKMESSSARPSPAPPPLSSTDAIHANFQSAGPLALSLLRSTGLSSGQASPSVSTADMKSLTGSGAMTGILPSISTFGSAPLPMMSGGGVSSSTLGLMPQLAQTLVLPPSQVTAQHEPNIELPVVIPSALLSKESRRELIQQHDAIFADRACQANSRKRKRTSEDAPDTSNGWLRSKRNGSEQKQFYLQVLSYLRSQKDPSSGRQLSASIIALPSIDKFPQFYDCIKDTQPPTLTSVEKHIRTNLVPDPTDFDAEMITILTNGRLWPSAGMNSSDGEALPAFYGDVISLQRLYNEITKDTGLSPSEVITPVSLASVSYGPGSAPLEVVKNDKGDSRYVQNMASNRLRPDQKNFLQSVQYKGDEIEPGDFIHMYNPSDPRLPIIAQVFKCYRHAGTGNICLSTNWYYRPSQTLHLSQRTFYEQEIFKTSLFIDHKIQDFIEKVCVMHIEDYIKGRFDFWNNEMPLYVVEHRWIIETGTFAKIKKWSRCVPEGRTPGPNRLRTFLEPVAAPPRIKSPFVRNPNITGPGQLADPLEDEGEDQDDCYHPLNQWAEGAGQVVGWGRLTSQKKLSASLSQYGDTEKREIVLDREQDTSMPAAERQPNSGNESRISYEPRTQLETQAKQEHFELLPGQIAEHFRRHDRAGDVLWWTCPPLEIAIDHIGPRYSLDYLARTAEELGY